MSGYKVIGADESQDVVKKRVAVYTCITGDYDDVKEFPSFREDGVDYLLFTNNREIKSSFWKVIRIENDGLDNVRLARKIKILGHELLSEYDLTIWIDGASFLRAKASAFLEDCCDLDEYSLIGFKHRERDCAYAEALECVKVNKDDCATIVRQMQRYRDRGYPEHNGLIESTVIVRRNHDSLLQKTMEMWFSEVRDYSRRDQLSFNYVAEQSGLNYNLLELNVFDNRYFGWEKHVSGRLHQKLSSYRVLCGGDDGFSFDGYLEGEYEVRDGMHRLSFSMPVECSELKIEFARHAGILFSSLSIDAPKLKGSNLVNWRDYCGRTIFDGGVPTLFLYGSFEKGDHVELSLSMRVLSDDELLELASNLLEDVFELKRKLTELQAETEGCGSRVRRLLRYCRSQRNEKSE